MKHEIPTAKGVSRRIRLQVERHGLTVAAAASSCELSKCSFEDYLYGKTMPGGVALLSLATGLRCSFSWLATGAGKA
ncbi:transcriptional regulator [Cypionkella psychrotolerans]|uniref:transcriptional regulator n=1 Tax=Cypionkella psychrotolerans TaxID=1678131 RepID=UPI0006B6259C|nr:transcriptional regulator [Cypionkella psychrotolerans]